VGTVPPAFATGGAFFPRPDSSSALSGRTSPADFSTFRAPPGNILSAPLPFRITTGMFRQAAVSFRFAAGRFRPLESAFCWQPEGFVHQPETSGWWAETSC
jgi:hypothetical protein